jgi:hypothetical protein
MEVAVGLFSAAFELVCALKEADTLVLERFRIFFSGTPRLWTFVGEFPAHFVVYQGEGSGAMMGEEKRISFFLQGGMISVCF